MPKILRGCSENMENMRKYKNMKRSKVEMLRLTYFQQELGLLEK